MSQKIRRELFTLWQPSIVCSAMDSKCGSVCVWARAARWGQHAIADYLLNLPSAFSKAASTYGSAGLTAAETARTWGFDALADMIETRGAVAKRE